MPSDTTHPDIQQCTCLSIYEFDHDHDCELWDSPGFCSGLLGWDGKTDQLVPTDSSYYQLSDAEVANLADKVRGDEDEDEHNPWAWHDEFEKKQKGRVFVAGPDGQLVEVDDDYEPPFEEPGPDWKGIKGLVSAAADRVKSMAKGETKQPAKAKLIECTCTPKDKQVDRHKSNCDLWDYPPWVYQECEWDHKKRRLLWYDPTKNEGAGFGEPTRLSPPPGGPKAKVINKNDIKKGSQGTLGFKSNYVPKDRHYEQPVKFPNDVTVYASSRHDRKADDDIPDWGLYVDSSWRPAGLATFIPWTDHGQPKINWHLAASAIIDAYDKAKQGLSVEIGCIGGHGRTGTVLACMAILSGVKPDEACAWVWANYCGHAIEDDSQVWWIEWFASKVTDWPAPLPTEQLYTSAEPKPKPKAKTFSGKATPDLNGKKGTPNPDVPYCGDCDEPRWAEQKYLCNKSGCRSKEARNNFTTIITSDPGKQALDQWRGKGKNKEKPKAKTPPKAKTDTEKSGATSPVVEADDFVPFCHGCNTTRFKDQGFVCRNPKCRPNYTITCHSPRGKRILTRWRNATATSSSS